MIASGIVFKASEEVDFVAELAGWISPPTQTEAAPAAASAEPDAEGQEASAQAEELQPSAFQLECADLESRGDFEQLNAKLQAAVKERFGSAPVQDVECAYAILLQLLMKWELLPTSILGLADELCSSTEERPKLRRTLLLSLYSLVQQCALLSLRFPILMKLILYCSSTSLLDPLLGGPQKRIASVEKWVREWKLNTDQKRELWGAIFDAYLEDPAATYENALKYLPLHEGLSLQAQPQLKTRLVQGLLVAIRSPSLLNCDKLVQLSVVQQLQTDAEYALLFRLLKLHATGMYQEYLTFYADPKAKSFMEEHQVLHEACEHKMRLLTLVSLAQSEKELTYAAIATALEVPNDQVERWVMEAISSGLITAKMDQVRELVIVSVCREREFGMGQWERLKGSLSEWGNSVQGLLHVVHASRSTVAA